MRVISAPRLGELKSSSEVMQLPAIREEEERMSLIILDKEEEEEEGEVGENLLVSESRKLVTESEYQIKVARVRSFPLQDIWQQSEKSKQTEEPELIKNMVRN